MAATPLTWSNIQSTCANHTLFSMAKFCMMPFVEKLDRWPTSEDLNQITKGLIPDFPWTFIEQQPVPRRAKSRGQASLSGYVSLIGTQGKIPVRTANTHDFLNSISFLMFPLSKKQLNLRHHSESPSGLKPGSNRTRTQDLLTIFDEGGVIRLLGDEGSSTDLIFGHAIYEHILLGKRLRAARLDLPANEAISGKSPWELASLADQVFAKWLSDPGKCRAASEFSHVWIEP